MKSLELLRGDKWISYNSSVAKEIGIVETIFLMNLVTKYYYFQDAGALIEYNNDYYFYYTSETIENDTAITYKQLQRIIPNLTNLGFIKTVRKGLPAKIYFSINEQTINEYFFSRTQINQKQDITKGNNLTIPKVITTHNQKSDIDNTKSNNIIYNINDKNENKIKDNIKNLISNQQLDFVSDEYKLPFYEWLDFKKEQFNFNYKNLNAIQKVYNQLIKYSNNDPKLAITVVENSIAGGYKGLFPLKEVNNANSSRNSKPNKYPGRCAPGDYKESDYDSYSDPKAWEF